ncbi:Arc family DNA-binding protein [Sinorhizobium sp. BJ1]|uniref:Arc family DNA-binding protein n=1 Tax=Sinorhizobium sp. BJ1 TaxID=2035455 RepID=UPI000BEAC40A|nr:Arc family DNA-binding protein [Sinorhizobium sp. BJ1]PDT80044.1 hypothetical protein CO676_29805 [Sinorhizobium sp. BJ1]
MTKKPVIQPQDKYVLRLPDGMRDRIKAAADRNGRSMNAEIIATLEEAYPNPFEQELHFLDEIDDLAKKLERIRAARIAEIEKGRVEVKEIERFLDNRDEFVKKPEK